MKKILLFLAMLPAMLGMQAQNGRFTYTTR